VHRSHALLAHQRCACMISAGLRATLMPLLNVPLVFAFLNIIAVYANPTGAVLALVVDLQSMLQIQYVLQYATHLLTTICLGEGGYFSAMEEALHRVGTIFEKIDVPQVPISPPPCRLLWCRCAFTPGTAFLEACVQRLNIALGLQFIVLVSRQALVERGLETEWSLILTFGSIIPTFLMLSVNMTLVPLLQTLSLPLPEQQKTEGIRQKQSKIIVLVMSALHKVVKLLIGAIEPGCLWFDIHEVTFLAFEIFVLALLGHRVWVPPFSWALFKDDKGKLIAVANKTTGSYEETRSLIAKMPTTLNHQDLEAVMQGTKTIEQVSAAALTR